ncbi:hypothetical protein KCP78_25840 (plasmid) [Salmonella enterica subsp. enterica]|nr:hypothetical protein KCP78_25840 [Salmonella enterica subsp. enterica]
MPGRPRTAGQPHDPNAPENRRVLVTPSALPETKQEAAQGNYTGFTGLSLVRELKPAFRTSLEALLKAQVLRWYAPQKQHQHCRPGRGRNIRPRASHL